MESKSVDTRSIYRELGATLSYNMRLGNGMEIEPCLNAKWHLNRSQFGIRIDHDLASISDHS
ncbi:autotransporter outer membrane beta-barrel domain-containing protein, partial [Escherichia coli]